MSSAASSSPPLILMDPFCLKQFAPNTTGGQHIAIPCSADDFTRRTNAWLVAQGGKESAVLKEGYAPFCKHLFIPVSEFDFGSNAAPPCAYARITDLNRSALQSMYSARTEKELPVLTRFFTKGTVQPHQATFMDVILYSREQIAKENAAMANKPSTAPPAASAAPAAPAAKLISDSLSTAGVGTASSTWEWGIVSIKPQDVAFETPMNPITIMRNALGIEEGGSGIPMDRQAYLKSVAFWQEHALVQ